MEGKEEGKEEDYSLDKHTKILFVRNDALKDPFEMTEHTSFKLSDTRKLKVFYSERLAGISKKVLESIVSVWLTVRGQQCAEMRKKQKMGEFRRSATFPCYSLPQDLMSQAADLLINETKPHESRIMDLESRTEPVVENISASQFCTNAQTKEEAKRRVQREVLPNLFHVAKLHEDLCRSTSKDCLSRSEIFIAWSNYPFQRHQRIQRSPRVPQEDTTDEDGHQQKRQRRQPTREADITSHNGTIHRLDNSLRPVQSPAPFYPSHAAHDAHVEEVLHASMVMTFRPGSTAAPSRPQQRMSPDWLSPKYNDAPYEALRWHTATHEYTNATVATKSEATNSTTMQPNYLSRFNSDRCEYNSVAPYWSASINNYQL